MKKMRDHSLGGIILGLIFSLFLTFVSSFYWLPPMLESNFPVVSNIRVSDAVRDDKGMVSFYLTVHKKRDGEPRSYAFFVEDTLHQKNPVNAFKGNADCSEETKDEYELINHPADDSWTYHYCFQMAADMMEIRNPHIVGDITHTAFPSMYGPIHYTIPAFELKKVVVIPPHKG